MVKFTAEGTLEHPINFVGIVPLTDKPSGTQVGVAQVEILNGKAIYHAKLSPGFEDLICSGFNVGDFSIMEDSNEDLEAVDPPASRGTFDR